MTEREQQIIDIIKADPLISQQHLADIIGISRSAIATHITNLSAKGIIKGKGYVIAQEPFCVAIGGANIDILARPLQPLVKQSSNPSTISNSLGGVARNIAENVSRLGNKCFLITAVGNDTKGQQLVKQSEEAGITTSSVVVLDNQSTSCYMSIVDETGEMQLAVSDMAILDHFGPADIKKQLPLISQAETIIIDTNLSDSLLLYLFEQTNNQFIFADTVSVAKAKKIRPFLSKIHTLKPNLKEAETLSGISVDCYSKLPLVAKWFLDKGVKQIFISLGGDGLFYANKHESKQIHLPPLEIKNTNGAGDAMMAAIAHCWINKTSIEQSAYFALAAANCALQTSSTINTDISIKKIESLLKESPC